MHHIGRSPSQVINIDPVFINTGITASHTVCPVDLFRFAVTGTFQTNNPLPSEKLNYETVKIICSRSDHNLIRIDQHTSERNKIWSNSLTQFPHSGTEGWLHKITASGADYLPDDSIPDGKRKVVRCRTVVGKIHFTRENPFCRQFYLQINGTCSGSSGDILNVRHKISPSGTGDNVAFANQLVICILYRYGTNAVVLGKSSFGWQSASRRNCTI